MKYIATIVGAYFILHSFRDLCQYFGIKNIFTELGHKFGIQQANLLLRLFGLSYKTEYEIYFFIFELLIGLLILYLVWRR